MELEKTSDLFSNANPYYRESHDLPHMSPLSWKYTQSEKKNNRQRNRDFRTMPYRKHQNFDKPIEKKEVFKKYFKSILKKYKEIFFSRISKKCKK